MYFYCVSFYILYSRSIFKRRFLRSNIVGKGNFSRRGFCSGAMSLQNEAIKCNDAFPPMNINIGSCSYCIQKQNKPNMEIRPIGVFFVIFFLFVFFVINEEKNRVHL